MRQGKAATATTLFLLAGGLALAQGGGWEWPATPQNLTELPADVFKGDRLRPVMTGFTRALGVTCAYCHVGTDGEPLSTYEFASDANPNKNRARKMLQLLGGVSEKLKEIEPSGSFRVNMWCHTCHRGRPKPMTIAEELREVYPQNGIEATVAHYETLRERYHGRGAYDFGETALNSFGYSLLGQDHLDDAIAIFRLNARYYPESGNAWDSLAEAYARAGKPEQARVYYRKSLELDPSNDNAVEKLRELD